ncbi:MAG: tripartite tricarboxylate transporter TctB family protein [Ruthenibacterium sp.]
MNISTLKKHLRNKELLIALGIFALGIFLTICSVQYQTGVRMFPVLVGICFIGIGAAMTITAVKKGKEENDKKLFPNQQELLLFGVMLAVSVLMTPLGFYASLLLGMIVICLMVFDEPQKKKLILVSVLFSIVVVAVLFVLFRLILFIPTPVGLLF